MNTVLAVAEQMLVDSIIGDKPPVTGESKLKIASLAFSFVMGVMGVGFSLYAFYLWLDLNFTPMMVMALMGAVTLTLSLTGFLIFYAVLRYKRYRMHKMKNELIKTAEETLEIFEEELSTPVQNNPKAAILVSSIAGFIAGDRFL